MKSFKYRISINLDKADKRLLKCINDDISELVFSSHIFMSIDNCNSSCESIIGTLHKKLNSRECPLLIVSESNLADLESGSLPDNWEEDEMRRIWVFNSETKETVIKAHIFSHVHDEIFATKLH